MKELSPIVTVKTEQVRPDKREYKFLGTLRRGDGHTIYEYNIVTEEIKPSMFAISSYNYWSVLKGDYSIRRRINVRENCLYLSALNVENAERKFKDVLHNLIRTTLGI